MAKAYAAYGLPVALSLILALVLSTTDRFLLAAFLNEQAVGVYHAGYSLGSRTLDVVFIWLGMAGGPALVAALERGGHPALKDAAHEQAGFMVLLTLPAAVGLALVGRPLAQVMVGAELSAGAGHVVPWIAVAGWLSGVTTYYLLQAFTLGKKHDDADRLHGDSGRRQRGPEPPADPALRPGRRPVVDRRQLWRRRRGGRDPGPPGLPPARAMGRLAKSGLACVLMAAAVLAVPAFGAVVELILKASVGAVVYGVVVLALDAGGLRGRVRGHPPTPTEARMTEATETLIDNAAWARCEAAPVGADPDLSRRSQRPAQGPGRARGRRRDRAAGRRRRRRRPDPAHGRPHRETEPARPADRAVAQRGPRQGPQPPGPTMPAAVTCCSSTATCCPIPRAS
jgi:hypothetical protein